LGNRWLLPFWLTASGVIAAGASIEHDVQNKRLILSDAGHRLLLSLNYDGKCLLDQVSVNGHQVVREDTGVCSAIKIGDQWFTTRSSIRTPQVKAASDTASITGIRFGPSGQEVSESWSFTVHSDGIVWRIDRTYQTTNMLEDSCTPGWDFQDMSTWTGALLGNGGVAWSRLFDAPNASYAIHNGKATFWNKNRGNCLRIIPSSPTDSKIAVRFSRQPSGAFSFNYSVTRQELIPKQGQ